MEIEEDGEVLIILGRPFLPRKVYVDDLIHVGNDLDEIITVKLGLNNRFKIKDLGHLKYLLHLEIARSKANIHICLRKYTLNTLSEFGLLASKFVSTPMTKGTRLTQE
ncbi:hypothetical protein CR513_57409, partial [Mucuna pruriens]